MDSREAFIALNMIRDVGPVRVRQLLTHFGEASDILAANKSQLEKVQGIGSEIASAISGWEKTVDLKGELKRIEEFGCEIVIQSDDNYPELLTADHPLRHGDGPQACLSTGLHWSDDCERRRARDRQRRPSWRAQRQGSHHRCSWHGH